MARGFSENLYQSIFLGLAFNNLMARGFDVNLYQSIFLVIFAYY
jgi:hypothetical protein